jgi:endo-1,4-beta-xylanase
VVNEAVIMPVYQARPSPIVPLCAELGAVEIIRRAFAAARAAAPGATLVLNDFDVTEKYEQLIEKCLAAGIDIDVIGIQSHMHQGYWGAERTQAVLEHFHRFNLPIHFTENTILSGTLMPPEIVDLNDYQVAAWPTTPDGEARQAEEVVTHYETLLSHPAIQAITWWGLPDGGWLNAPSGLVRADGSTKPAYEALHGLIRGDWWLAPTRLVTDDLGRAWFTGFLGEYECTWGGGSAVIRVDRPGSLAIEARLGA